LLKLKEAIYGLSVSNDVLLNLTMNNYYLIPKLRHIQMQKNTHTTSGVFEFMVGIKVRIMNMET